MTSRLVPYKYPHVTIYISHFHALMATHVGRCLQAPLQIVITRSSTTVIVGNVLLTIHQIFLRSY